MEDKETNPIKCYIHSLSPVKNSSSKRKFFNCWIQKEKEIERVVCFDARKHDELDTLKKTKSAINLHPYRKSSTGEIILDDKSKFSPVQDVGFDYIDPVMPNDVVSIAKLVDVASEQLVKVKAQVLSISGPKVINTQHQGTLRKQDVILRDTATSIKLVLWDHYVDSLEANKTYLFENVKLKSNRYGRYLNTAKDAEFRFSLTEPFEQDLAEVEDAVVQNDTITGKIIGINQITHKIACVSCNKKVVPCPDNSTLFGTCEECKTWQNLDFCDRQWMVRVIVASSNDSTVKRRLVMYNQQLMMLGTETDSLMNLRSITEGELKMQLSTTQPLTFSYEMDTQLVTDISTL